jgi:hypothetical protein
MIRHAIDRINFASKFLRFTPDNLDDLVFNNRDEQGLPLIGCPYKMKAASVKGHFDFLSN